MKTIGIIGGIGPESTIDYYRRLLAAYGQRRPGEAAPAIIINSIDVRKLLALAAGQLDRLTEYLLDEIARLHRAGAQIGCWRPTRRTWCSTKYPAARRSPW